MSEWPDDPASALAPAYPQFITGPKKKPLVGLQLQPELKFSKELLNELDKLNQWPDKVRAMQKNWIGVSEGVEIIFYISEKSQKIKVFTTRPETIFGATFIALSVEHEIASFYDNDSVKLLGCFFILEAPPGRRRCLS